MYDQQFYGTSNRLIRDVSAALGRDMKDPTWLGGFCFPMIGSFGHECGGFLQLEEGKPTVPGSAGGVSFPQWTGFKVPNGRRGLFMAFCRKHGLHPYSYEAGCGFIIEELTGMAAHVPAAVLATKAKALDPGDTRDPLLYARVVKFEVMYEGAGIKHYDSRYANAIKARDAFLAWSKAGFDDLPPFVMKPWRNIVAFDKEFGLGVSDQTVRWDGKGSQVAAAPAVAPFAIVPAKVVLGPGVTMDFNAPAATPKKGAWPEGRLLKKEIEAIQERLRDLGYVQVGAIDGKWGGQTRAAIVALQTNAGIETDGHWGTETRTALIKGVRHVVAPERAMATAKALLDAGEPTLTAVHPVAVVSKFTTYGATAMAIITGISTAWPQASAAVDGLRSTLGDVPGWVYLAITAAIAAYLWISTREVKKVAVEAYRTGASTALAAPIYSAPTSLEDSLPSAEPDEPEHDLPDADDDGARGILAPGEPEPEPAPEPEPEPDAPAPMTWADLQRMGH